MERSITEVYDLLYSLGLTADHTYFFHTAHAVWLCVHRQERLLLVTKWLYPEVAEKYQTSWHAVEHSLRRAIFEVWTTRRQHLEQLTGAAMQRPPRPAQFLGILAMYLLNGRTA